MSNKDRSLKSEIEDDLANMLLSKLLFQKTLLSKLLFVFPPVPLDHLLAIFLVVPVFLCITDGSIRFKLVTSLNLVSESGDQSEQQ